MAIRSMVFVSASALPILFGVLQGYASSGPRFPGPHFEAGVQPEAIAVADFDGDGVPDMALVDVSEGALRVLLGNGDGTYRQGQILSIGAGGDADIAAADLDGDGVVDLVVSRRSSDDVVVLAGLGDGAFELRSMLPTAPGPIAVRIDDIDGDGVADLVVGCVAGDRPESVVSVFTGQGGGVFGARQDYSTAGRRLSSIALCDLESNGILDLVATHTDTNGVVTVLPGLGDGSFGTAEIIAQGGKPTAVGVGDLNGDRVPDLVIAYSILSDQIRPMLGNGDRTFSQAEPVPVGVTPMAVLVADLDNDGAADLIVMHTGLYSPDGDGGSISIIPGHGDGTFGPRRDLARGSQPTALAIGDLDGDGEMDLVATTESGSAAVLLGRGDGSFLLGEDLPAGFGPRAVAVGDWNSNGIPDLMTAGSGPITVHLAEPDGSYSQSDLGFLGLVSALATGDFDGDGLLDVLVVRRSANSVMVLFGDGAGGFDAGPMIGVGELPTSVCVGDFNADGIPDLAVTNTGSGSVSVLLGQGNGTFGPVQTYDAGSQPRSVRCADLNGNGLLDLVFVNHNSPAGSDATATVLLGAGDGGFHDAIVSPAPAGAFDLSVGDLDGDGVPDLAVATLSGLSVMFGQGDGSFGGRQDRSLGSTLPERAVAIADFDGDGVPDLVVTEQITVRVLTGLGGGQFGPGQRYGVGLGPISVVAVDLNADGAADILTVNTVGDSVSVLLNSGGPPPCPADLNHDGRLDFFDVAYFVVAFTAQDPVADYNGDGVFDFNDFAAFMADFNAGCP